MTRFLSRSAGRNLSAFAVTAFGAATLLMTAAMPARAANVGPDQRISLSTSPNMPAHCEFMNGAEYNTVTGVPARIQIMKSNGVMRVRCMSNDGLYRGAVEVKTKFAGAAGIASIPWTAFSIVDNVTNDFDDDMANSVSSSVQYPSRIVVPVTMINGGRIIPDAQVATDEDAVANQPLPDVEEAAPESASPPVHHVRKHKVVHHYHTQDSHS